MKFSRCPICRSHISLTDLVRDEVTGELLATYARLPARLATAVMGYLMLFKPLKSDLKPEKVLLLTQEVMALSSNKHALESALMTTTEQILSNRQAGQDRQLKNHNYLCKVLGDAQKTVAPCTPQPSQQPQTEQEKKAQEKAKQAQDKIAWEQMMNRFGQEHRINKQ